MAIRLRTSKTALFREDLTQPMTAPGCPSRAQAWSLDPRYLKSAEGIALKDVSRLEYSGLVLRATREVDGLVLVQVRRNIYYRPHILTRFLVMLSMTRIYTRCVFGGSVVCEVTPDVDLSASWAIHSHYDDLRLVRLDSGSTTWHLIPGH